MAARRIIILTVVAVAILAMASWWRSGHEAPLTAPPPSETSPTSILEPLPQSQTHASPSTHNQETVDPPSTTGASQTTVTPDSEDQPQVSPTPGTTPSAQTGQARER